MMRHFCPTITKPSCKNRAVLAHNALPEQPEEVPETITFRTADRMMYGALGYDGNELMAVISGYDLEIKFNMRLINSLADAEACANALADVFYEALMDQLIRENKPFAKPPEAKTPTLK